MKKGICAVVFLMLLIGDALAEEKVDGYFWSELAETSKAFFLSGFLTGHRVGEYEAMITGYIVGQVETIIEIEKDKALKIDDTFKKKIMKLTLDKELKGEFAISKYSVPAPLKMIGELDAFYKTYPLCKSRELDKMLSEFIKVWSIEDKKTYKEIGEKCAE